MPATSPLALATLRRRLRFASLVSTATALLVTLAALPQMARGEALPITLDGLFGDWTGSAEMTDATGDAGGSGIDFVELDFANDDDWMFVRFETSIEVGLQGGNNIVLYLDTDMNSGTGLSINGIGADLSWRFGDRQGTWHPTGTTVWQSDLSIRQLPTVTGSTFECAIARDAQPNGFTDLFPGNSFRALLVDTGGDQVPNNGMTVTYTFDATSTPGPTPTTLTREMPGDVRIVSWNTRDLEGGGLWNGTATAAGDRIFSALQPDIICFQEIYSASAAQTAALVESWLPSGGGPAWDARSNVDNKIVTRYPILGSWNINGNLAVLLDTTADWGAQALVISAHMPCCSNDAGRQVEADNMMAFLRDAMTVGGTLDVASGTVFVVTGDMNLVGFSQQLTTLVTGDIVDNGSYGPDFNPDWDGTDLADSRPIQSEARFAYTWRNDGSSFQPGRLDFIFYNDSTVDPGRSFVLYTPEMSGAELATYGMNANDVPDVSDHLPVVLDLREIVPSDVGPQGHGGGSSIEGMRSSAGSVRFSLTLDRTAHAAIDFYDVRGHHVAQLRRQAQGPLPAGRHAFTWTGDSSSGSRVPQGVYLLRVLTRFDDGTTQSRSAKALLRR